jgi:hypothetical protein
MSDITVPTGHTVTQMNTNTVQQIARAVNIDSPNTISIATNTNSTEQINLDQIILQNGLTGTRLDYGTIEANDNTTLQLAIAVNYDSPGATAIATNFSFTEQVNGFTAGAPHGGIITQVNDNSTVEIAFALNLDSPDAVAVAGNANVTEQVNGLTGGQAGNGNVVQVNSNTTIQFGIALDINSPGAIALASNSNTSIQENLLGTLLYGVGLSLADLGLPSFISGTDGAGPSFGVDHHEPNSAGFVMPQSTFHSSNLAPVFSHH